MRLDSPRLCYSPSRTGTRSRAGETSGRAILDELPLCVHTHLCSFIMKLGADMTEGLGSRQPAR